MRQVETELLAGRTSPPKQLPLAGNASHVEGSFPTQVQSPAPFPQMPPSFPTQGPAPTPVAPVVPPPIPFVPPLVAPAPFVPQVVAPSVPVQVPVQPPPQYDPVPVPHDTKPAHTLETFRKNFIQTIHILVSAKKIDQQYLESLKNYFKVGEIFDIPKDEQKSSEMFESFVQAGLITKVG